MRIQRALFLIPLLGVGLSLHSSAQRRLPNEQRGPEGPQVKADNPQQSQAVVRQVFEELFNRGRYEQIDKIYARDCIVHHNKTQYRLEESVSEGKGWRSAAPDLLMIPEQMSVQGNMVTVSWVAKGTNTGRGNGLMKPTGKRILVRGNSTFRVVNGKIAEVWNNFDRNEIFRQLGVSPTMAFLYEETEGLRLAMNRVFSSSAAPSQQ